jgi:hypothetical protein
MPVLEMLLMFFQNAALSRVFKLIFGKVRNAMRLVGTLKFKGDSLVANCGFFVNLQQYFLKKREA